jgi:peptidyl-prolyl cis-trans isomerase B (cyclophilin B)
MATCFLICVCLLAASQESPTEAAGPKGGITPEHLYNGVDRPAVITVVSPRSFGTVSLVLMTADGTVIETVEVHPGRIDLDEKLPAIWSLRKTAYLQLVDLQQPFGAALVLQPMVSRMVPQTREETHPVRGTKYSRIVGWVDENQLPLEPVPTTQPDADEPSSTAADPTHANPPVDSKPQPPPTIDRLFTGLRMYPEQDVILETTSGDIRLAMRPDEAPNTVWNFLELSRGGFYRDVAFHRIVPLINGNPFVVQAGDPTGTGDGGPGYWLPIENSQLEHDFGVISMARSDDPDSNGSQIFIALSRAGTARLDGQYCAFGYAVDGAETIKSIADVAIADTTTGRPVDPPLIRNAKVIPAPPRTPGRGRPDQRISPHPTAAPTRPTGKIPR